LDSALPDEFKREAPDLKEEAEPFKGRQKVLAEYIGYCKAGTARVIGHIFALCRVPARFES
jgi:hypothetical protein